MPGDNLRRSTVLVHCLKRAKTVAVAHVMISTILTDRCFCNALRLHNCVRLCRGSPLMRASHTKSSKRQVPATVVAVHSSQRGCAKHQNQVEKSIAAALRCLQAALGGVCVCVPSVSCCQDLMPSFSQDIASKICNCRRESTCSTSMAPFLHTQA